MRLVYYRLRMDFPLTERVTSVAALPHVSAGLKWVLNRNDGGFKDVFVYALHETSVCLSLSDCPPCLGCTKRFSAPLLSFVSWLV